MFHYCSFNFNSGLSVSSGYLPTEARINKNGLNLELYGALYMSLIITNTVLVALFG